MRSAASPSLKMTSIGASSRTRPSPWSMASSHALIEVIFSEGLAALRIRLLPIQVPHVARVAALPHHHRDPFDRLMVAAALTEKLAVVTKDRMFTRYGVTVVW